MAFFQGSKYTYFVVLTADIIAFITGTSLAWTSPILPILESNDYDRNPLHRKIKSDESSWIGSLAAMGGIFGPWIFCFMVEKIGRKLTISLISIPFLIAYLIAAFAENVILFYVARILMGVGVGGMFCMLPIYVVEIAENVNRGVLQASNSTSIMLGILFSYCVGPYVSILTFNLILSAICIIFVPIFWFIAPETPYFLVKSNKEEEALKSLQYLRHKPSYQVEEELEDIKSHLKQLQPASYLDIFRTKATIKAFSYGIALTTFQQFSGVVVILYFTQNIFDAGGNDIPPEVCSIIVGASQFVVSCISPPFVDKVGRKILLLISVTGSIIAEVLLGAYFNNGMDVPGLGWLPVFSLVVFIVFYNFGMGSIPWAFMGETLPLNIISNACVTATSFYWFTGFFLTKYFGDLSEAIGMGGSFWFFAGFCVAFDLFVLIFMFETKGKSLSEIQAILNK